MAYHVIDDYSLTAEWCRVKCNLNRNCNFWDFGEKDLQLKCKLYQGFDHELKDAIGYYYGSKNCPQIDVQGIFRIESTHMELLIIIRFTDSYSFLQLIIHISSIK